MINIIPWIFPFILGIYLSHNKVFEIVYNYMNEGKHAKYLKAFLSFIVLGVLLYYRQFIGQNIYNIRYDVVLGLTIIIVNYLYLNKIKMLNKAMIYLGSYSLDIFLVHMFLTHYYTKPFVYSLKYPIIMFIFVTGVSLLIAMALKYIKDKIGLNKLFVKVN
jgi:membrane-bound acyltransferase YfiQ involved in biofilm formation